MAKYASDFDNDVIPLEENIVTNNTFIDTAIIQEVHRPMNDVIKSRVTSFFQEQAQSEENAIQNAIRELFCIDESASKSPNLMKITNKILNFFKEGKFNEMNTKKLKLKGHVGLYPDTYPWIDLEAAKILELDAALIWSPPTHAYNYKPPKLPLLPAELREPLGNGQYVPLEHLLHGLSTATFYPQFEIKYPFPLLSKLPTEFLIKIKKSDVVRGATVHSLFLGLKFPIFASTLPGLIEELWHFMYIENYSPLAGIELYNEVFYEFSLNLGLCIVKPIDHVSPIIYNKVKETYKNGRAI